MTPETYACIVILGIVCAVFSIAALIADFITEDKPWFSSKPMAVYTLDKDEEYDETTKRG